MTATYDLGPNPRVMATVNGQPQYGLVFTQRSRAVTFNNVQYGTQVLAGYLDAQGRLNDGAGNLWLDLIPNLGAAPDGTYYVATFNIQGQVHAEIWVVPDVPTVTAEEVRQSQPPAASAPAVFYQFIQKDGSDLPQRRKLNLTGTGVSCADNAGALSTDCAISGGGGGGGGTTHQIDGVNLAAQDPVNFQDTSEIDFSNPSAGNIRAALKNVSIAAARFASGTALSTHTLFADGTGGAAYRAIADSDVPDTISISNLTQVATRNYSDLQNVPTQFNPSAHALVGGAHTASGLTAGHHLRATGATTFAFGAVEDADLPASITRDSEINVQGTANQIVSSGSGSAPILSISNPFVFPGKFTGAASTISAALANFPSGDAPTTPATSDFWNESSVLKFRTASATESLLFQSRHVNTSAPLGGGGALTADLSLTCATCEVTTNKNAASGYAGLTAGTKLQLAQGQEVWAIADLTDYTGKSGSGTTAIGATITTPGDNQCLTWDDATSNWVNETCPGGGGGITSLNSLTAASQTLVTGTGGTDFNIDSAISTHTFNLPVASGTNTGKLSSTDWTTFNSKLTSPLTTRGDLLTRDASTHIRLPIGGVNTVLATDGTDPAWTTLGKSHLPAAIAYEDEANILTAAGGVTMDNQLGIRLRELTANGTNYIEHRAVADAGAGNTTYTWPASTDSRFLFSGTGGALAWNQASGVGGCTNQFVRTLNNNAAPTCATVTSTDTSGTFPADAHQLTGATHTETGLTTGQPLRATGATTFAFGALDLSNSSAVTNALAKTNQNAATAYRDEANVFTATGGVTLDNGLAIRLRELTGSGTNFFALKAPDAITSDFTLTWAATGECTGTNDGKLTINASNEIVCADDISGGAAGGYAGIDGNSGTADRTGTERLDIVGTTNEISTAAADGAPDDSLTVSLATQLNLSGKEIIGGAVPLLFEGATDNNIYWKFSITDPTVADKTTTVPNFDTVLVQPQTCTNQLFSALSGTTGALTCTTVTSAMTSGTFDPDAHALVGAKHTASGLTTGHHLRATGATTFAFAAVEDGDLPASIARDTELHSQSHVIADTTGLGPDHTTSGLTAGQVLRASGGTTAAFGSIQDADLPATITRDSEINVQGTANEITSSGSGPTPTLSLSTQLNLSGKEIVGGGTPLKFEGATDDNIYINLVVTDPTVTSKNFTLPNADSVAVQPQACTSTDKVSAISAAGVITCSADETGAGGGDEVSVAGTAATNANFSNTNPAAEAGFILGKFQIDTVPSPDDISLEVAIASASVAGVVSTTAQTFAGAKTFTGNMDLTASGDVLRFRSGPAAGSFAATAAGYVSLGQSMGTALNSDGTRRVALLGVHEDGDGTNDVFGAYGMVDSRHTTGTKNQVQALAGDAYHSAAGTVGSLIGVGGFAEMDETAGTVTSMAALQAFTNVRSAGTVDNNYGLLIANQAGVGTNNWGALINMSPAERALELENPNNPADNSFADSPESWLTGIRDSDGGVGITREEVNWKNFVDLTAVAGDSTFRLQSRIGAAAFADRFTVTDASVAGATIFDAGTGLHIAGAATTGRFLRGNGTNFVVSSGAASGTGGCTNQFVRTLNDDAAPTCASVATADITDANVTPAKLSTAARSLEKAVSWENPATADSYKWMVINPAAAVTLTRVHCAVLGGTSVTINLRKTSEATPFSGGTAALTSNLVCDTDGANSTSFSSAGVAANTPLVVEVTAVSGSVTNIIIGIHATRD